MSVHELATYYKHLMNIVDSSRCINTVDTCPAWGGWMRCKITPYLDNNRIIDDQNTYVSDLIYTIQDHIEYMELFSRGSTINIRNRTKALKLYVQTTPNLITIIENNSALFPDKSHTLNNNLIEEDWNLSWIRQNLYKT